MESPHLCCRMIMCHVLGLGRSALIAHADERLAPDRLALFLALAKRRERGEPMAYILGHKEFYGRDFLVSPGVLVPRPETELLVELAAEFGPNGRVVFADMGTGSGCVGISLACEHENFAGFLADTSLTCLNVARANINKLAPAGCCLTPIAADMTEMPFADACLDIVVSNPPYIGHAEAAEVMPDVLAYEPGDALFSGQDGLWHIRALAGQARRVLKPGGLLAMEHGWRQGGAVRAILRGEGYGCIETRTDLAGRERATCARKN